MRRLLLLVLPALTLAGGCAPSEPAPVEPGLDITEILGGADTASFARAMAPRRFAFPADHGPHPDFRTEWWYFTGNLSAAEHSERQFGYQLTFFRSALAAEPEPRESVWAATQAYMAHFAVVATGPAGGFFSYERYARGAGGMAGAQAVPFGVWLEDWSAEGGEGIPPIRLRAREADVAIDLTLEPGKPPVLQGDRGLSQKGREPGNASYYYSLTRLPTTGEITFEGETYRASGASWMDREWSTSSLDEDVVGWDWFALQLDDGRDLMVYQLRRADGSAAPQSAGTLVQPDGSATPLAVEDYRIQPRTEWRSPDSDRAYPSGWTLSVPLPRLELRVEPLLRAQELVHSFVYWEGAVRVSGTAGGAPVSGRGYVELTGY